MKTQIIHLVAAAIVLLALSTLNSQLSTAFAQGSLTPPGSPAPTMKSADQIYAQIIGPRTPISSAPFNITNSGSYYLTTNLTVSSGDGIDINTNAVTLDLNGFTISSTAGSATGDGISLNSSYVGNSDITIFNGHICGGFVDGIGLGHGYTPANVVVSKVSVSGVSDNGISLGHSDATVVEACTVTSAGGNGISASNIKGSVAVSCGGSGIDGDVVADCWGYSFGSQTGVEASFTAQNCYGRSDSGTGLQARIAIGCMGFSSSGIGLQATNATSCYVAHGTTNIVNKYDMP